MALKYIAGTLPSFGVYAIVPGLLSRLPTGRWVLNADTVSSVELVGAGKEYNYAQGGMGMFAGAAIAGPIGMLVGGLAPKAFKDEVIQFVIRFSNGDVAHFAGSRGDYRRALKASYKPSTTAATPQPDRGPTEVERLRAEVARLKAGRDQPDELDVPEPEPDAPHRTMEEVRLEMAAEREAREAENPGGRLGIWLADVPERQFVPPPEGEESPQERQQRQAQNDQYRKEHKAALRAAKKAHEKVIQKDKMSFRERFRLLDQLEKEYVYRLNR